MDGLLDAAKQVSKVVLVATLTIAAANRISQKAPIARKLLTGS